MGLKRVTKPQREVILRQGPFAGMVIMVDVGQDEIELSHEAGSVKYRQDPDFKDYFVHEPLEPA